MDLKLEKWFVVFAGMCATNKFKKEALNLWLTPCGRHVYIEQLVDGKIKIIVSIDGVVESQQKTNARHLLGVCFYSLLEIFKVP